MYLENNRRRRVTSVLVALLAAIPSGVGMPSASADTASPVTEIATGSALSQPCNVQAAPDTSQWFIEHGTRRLGRLDLKTGVIQKFDLPPVTVTPVLPVGIQLPGVFPIGPCDMTVPGDGNLWFNDQYNNAIGYISLDAPSAVHEIPLPTPASIPTSLAVGANGDIYVTQTGSDQIAEIDVATKAVTEYTVPTLASGIIGSIAGQDGAHWFVEIAGNKLLRLDYATKQIKELTVPTPAALPFVIRSYDGQIWFTESGVNAIGHFDPTTETFSEVTLPALASVPIGLTRGVDGSLYTDESIGNKIAKIDPATETVQAEYPVPTPVAFPDESKTGPDGAIWSPEFFAGKIARLWPPGSGADPGVPQNGGSVTGATTLDQDLLRMAGLGP